MKLHHIPDISNPAPVLHNDRINDLRIYCKYDRSLLDYIRILIYEVVTESLLKVEIIRTIKV